MSSSLHSSPNLTVLKSAHEWNPKRHDMLIGTNAWVAFDTNVVDSSIIFDVDCGKASNEDVASLETLEFGAYQEFPYPHQKINCKITIIFNILQEKVLK